MNKKMTITTFILIILVLLISTSREQQNPHGKIKFKCEVCHRETSFQDVSFDHSETGFDLEQQHEKAPCTGCHKIKNFSDIEKKNCISCHKDIHDAKFGIVCEKCHTGSGWENFDVVEMHWETNFPVTGRHALIDCQSCHKELSAGDMSFNTTQCFDCHVSDYEQANHSPSGGFTFDCEYCHQMNRWRPSYFANHDMFFPIFSGNHNKEWDECSTCHFDPSSMLIFSCLNCHEHNQTETDNNHSGISGYLYNSDDCYICHPTGEAGDFGDHGHFFPIFSGVHNNLWDECTTCHIVPDNRKIVSCFNCHQHNQTDTDPIHTGIAGYTYNSIDCYFCHPAGEAGSYLEHDPQFFPIFSGTHNNQWSDCSVCHTTPSDRRIFNCLSCHRHNQTDTDVSHSGIPGYAYNSQDCYFCHPTGEPGVFAEHDPLHFPIFSGTHLNQWNECAICHVNSTDRKMFSCLICHQHNQTDTDINHSGMTGYSYNSNECYFCHPTGNAGQFLAHDAQFFPIFSGKHNNQWNDCSVCHTVSGDRKVFDCLSCHKHNQTDADAAHQGIPGYNYNSSDCYFCHPTGEAGSFVNHDAQFFPIFSGKHNGKWSDCSTCHYNSNDRSIFTCFDCHQHNKTKVDDQHKGRKNYIYDSNACYSCHPNGKG